MYNRSVSRRTGLALAALLTVLAGCDDGDDGSATGSFREETVGGEGTTNSDGPEFYLSSMPSPCSRITEAVARNLLNVGEVVALPNNSTPESLNPRCVYRDGESLGKAVSITVVSTPYETFSARMPATEVLALVNRYYGQEGAPYETVDLGPGAMRFVSATDDAASMFVMPGLGVPGGSFDPSRVNAEAAFAVSLKDPARNAEQRLAEARNLAVAYHSNLVNAAVSR
jgi:hypothetical protein